MEQTIEMQKERLREMNIIGVLAKEYVTVCYVDVEKDLVTSYRMDPFIEEHYGDVLRAGVTFEQVFRAYVTRDIYEEDQGFFLDLANLQDMLAYLRMNGSLSKKYRVWRISCSDFPTMIPACAGKWYIRALCRRNLTEWRRQRTACPGL